MAVASLGLLYAIIPVIIFYKNPFKGAWYSAAFNAVACPLGIIVMSLAIDYICIHLLRIHN